MNGSFPIDALVGLEEADLLAIKTKMVALIKEGKTVTSYAVGGRNTGKQIVASPGEILVAVRHALRQIDPETYGGPRITRTIAGFGGHQSPV